MAQGAEAFQLEHQSDEEPEEKKGADIYAFPEKGQNYGKYKSLGGILSPEEYLDVLKRVAEGAAAPSTSMSSEHANTMARIAEITLSPEIITIYGILSDKRSELAKELPNEMSDQKLLAEAFRMRGDARSLSALKEKYPNIFN